MRIFKRDIRLAGHCSSGARDYFERHGLDYLDFLVHGIDADEFVAKGDYLAQRVVDRKIEREQSAKT